MITMSGQVIEHGQLHASTWNHYMFLQLTFHWPKQITTMSNLSKEYNLPIGLEVEQNKILVNSVNVYLEDKH